MLLYSIMTTHYISTVLFIFVVFGKLLLQEGLFFVMVLLILLFLIGKIDKLGVKYVYYRHVWKWLTDLALFCFWLFIWWLNADVVKLGFAIFLSGILSNIGVMAFNGFKMPFKSLITNNLSEEDYIYKQIDDNTRLSFLADRIVLISDLMAAYFSIGDFFVIAGELIIVFELLYNK